MFVLAAIASGSFTTFFSKHPATSPCPASDQRLIVSICGSHLQVFSAAGSRTIPLRHRPSSSNRPSPQLCPFCGKSHRRFFSRLSLPQHKSDLFIAKSFPRHPCNPLHRKCTQRKSHSVWASFKSKSSLSKLEINENDLQVRCFLQSGDTRPPPVSFRSNCFDGCAGSTCLCAGKPDRKPRADAFFAGGADLSATARDKILAN